MCETLFHIEINSSGKLTFRKICSVLDQYEMLHIDMNVCRILNEFSQAGYALLIANDLHVLFFFFFSREYVLLHENSSDWCSLCGFSSMIFWHQHSGESRTFCLSIKSLFWYVGDLVVVLILLHLGIGVVLCLMWELNWFKLMGLTLSLCSLLLGSRGLIMVVFFADWGLWPFQSCVLHNWPLHLILSWLITLMVWLFVILVYLFVQYTSNGKKTDHRLKN